MKKEVKQIKISKRNAKLFLVPILEKTIQKSILVMKKKQSALILLGCISSSFGAFYTYYDLNYQGYTFTDGRLLNKNIKFWIQFVVSNLIQLLIGLTVDLISLHSSFIFSISISILSMVINIISISFGQTHSLLLGAILNGISFSCMQLCLTYILFDSSYSLRNRFESVGLFLALAMQLPVFLATARLLLQDKSIFISLILNSGGICTSVIGLICIYISYTKIYEKRRESILFNQFERHQGIGITLKSIQGQYKNKAVLFLVLIQFTFALVTSRSITSIFTQAIKESVNNQTFSTHQIYNSLLRISYSASTLIFGIPILLCISSRAYIIQSCMKTTQILLATSFITVLISCISIYFAKHIQFEFLYWLFLGVSIYNGSIHLIFIVIYGQLITCFQDSRSSLKCLGLAFISLAQDFSNIFFHMFANPIILHLFFLLCLVTAIVFSKFYLFNKSFQQLENQIEMVYDQNKRIAMKQTLSDIKQL